MDGSTSSDAPSVRTTELIAALSLATDLAMGFPLEYGLKSTLIAMRLCEELGVDHDTAAQAYHVCLLFYVGCNAPVDIGWDVFGDDDSLMKYATPYRFGTRAEMAGGMLRAIAPPNIPLRERAWRIARHGPALTIGYREVAEATCEVGKMLTARFGLDTDVSGLFDYESERWDGKGLPSGVGEEAIPLAVRIAHVARDTAHQLTLGDDDFVSTVIGSRAGGAFDPVVAAVVASRPSVFRDLADGSQSDSLWDSTLSAEPRPWATLAGSEIDSGLAAMGHFADMTIPELVGHSSGVAALVAGAAARLAVGGSVERDSARTALFHDLGRVAVPTRIWAKTGSLSLDEREQVRLHAYHTERVAAQSSYLRRLGAVAGLHHERLDGNGYHRGIGAASLPPPARLLAAADAYQAMTEPRPYRVAMAPEQAADQLAKDAATGGLDPDIVSAVLETAGQASPPAERPAGLTDRESEVVTLLARGLQTKQIARKLEISPKTADFHIQNAYRKIGVSTRAGATVFAMEHGLTTWENSP